MSNYYNDGWSTGGQPEGDPQAPQGQPSAPQGQPSAPQEWAPIGAPGSQPSANPWSQGVGFDDTQGGYGQQQWGQQPPSTQNFGAPSYPQQQPPQGYGQPPGGYNQQNPGQPNPYGTPAGGYHQQAPGQPNPYSQASYATGAAGAKKTPLFVAGGVVVLLLAITAGLLINRVGTSADPEPTTVTTVTAQPTTAAPTTAAPTTAAPTTAAPPAGEAKVAKDFQGKKTPSPLPGGWEVREVQNFSESLRTYYRNDSVSGVVSISFNEDVTYKERFERTLVNPKLIGQSMCGESSGNSLTYCYYQTNDGVFYVFSSSVSADDMAEVTNGVADAIN